MKLSGVHVSFLCLTEVGLSIPNLPRQWYSILSSLISALKIRKDCLGRVTKETVECSHRLYFYKFQVSL